MEYLDTSGSKKTGPNVLYGPGSDAWSATVTPTFQYNLFFARAELSYVAAGSTSPHAAFGTSGNQTSQFRGLVEAGIVF